MRTTFTILELINLDQNVVSKHSLVCIAFRESPHFDSIANDVNTDKNIWEYFRIPSFTSRMF